MTPLVTATICVCTFATLSARPCTLLRDRAKSTKPLLLNTIFPSLSRYFSFYSDLNFLTLVFTAFLNQKVECLLLFLVWFSFDLLSFRNFLPLFYQSQPDSFCNVGCLCSITASSFERILVTVSTVPFDR